MQKLRKCHPEIEDRGGASSLLQESLFFFPVDFHVESVLIYEFPGKNKKGTAR
jgi:hypothetical protein